ncbi:hypothetical protein BAOM_3107 [Peribacillus asahii]|uniref:Phage portal protein n=1 Tax=Peribacillus asahii TaxID=228899 RepID=A0A3Q9RPD9_9BACI|nr:hypothetical protein [Peribacillus asahii]AZV43716.1 hypothetical protein BAOM_3107 [Peribacillus asahii]
MTEQVNQNIPISFAQLGKLIYNDIEKSTTKSSIMTKYTKEQIVRFLENPKGNQKELRKLSNFLFNGSPNYRRLILYFANMLKFDYIVEPFDLNTEKIEIDKFKKQYLQTIKSLEIMNIPHEMQKVLKTCFKEDVFYGYEHSTVDSYFIQRLNPDFCRISSIEDGIYNFEFDFSFFNDSTYNVENYPQEFQTKRKLYLNDKLNNRWQELDSKQTICIKINDEFEYPVPPFNTVFEAVFDIDETKRMRKISTKMDNYMILTQQIPIDDKKSEPNQFLIDLDTAIAFHNKAIQSLPEEVGLVTSPMKIEAIKLERRNKDADHVAQSERDYYNASGVSQMLFNSDKTNSTALSKSITTDEQIVLTVLRQIERWVNRKLKYINNKYKFRVKFLDTTNFNYKEISDLYLKAAQYGMPVKQELAATLGLSPSSLISKTFLENDVLDLHNKLIPLSSSHTISGKDGAGRPTKNEDELSESGLKTKDTDGNIRE